MVTAVALVSMPAGATAESIAAAAGRSNAAAAPKTTAAMKICVTLSQPPKLPQARKAAVSPSTTWHTCTTRLRSKRSAAWPAQNTSTPIGMNCSSPTMPSAKALLVSS